MDDRISAMDGVIMKDVITSKDNKYIKLVRSLDKKKYRTKEGLFVAEGARNCFEAVISTAEVQYILVKESKYTNPEVVKVLAAVDETKTTVMTVEDKVFDSACHTEESQGIMALIKIKNLNVDDFAEKVCGKQIAVLDGLQDPGNMGTILRTAWAAGLGGIVSVNNSADVYNPKVVRSTMGAVYHLPVIRLDNAAAVEFLAANGYSLTVADAGGDDYRKFKADDKKVAWLLGSEGNGVSDFWRRQAGNVVSVPMAKNVESLNVAVAAGILFFSQAKL